MLKENELLNMNRNLKNVLENIWIIKLYYIF